MASDAAKSTTRHLIFRRRVNDICAGYSCICVRGVMECEARVHRSSGLAVGSSLAPDWKAPFGIGILSYGQH